MAGKEFTLDGELAVTIYKRRNSRNLRLSVTPHGKVRVTIPSWAPYKSGIDFAKSRQTWITSQLKPPSVLLSGQAIGKAHHLYFEPANQQKPSSRVVEGMIAIKYPVRMQSTDPAVQAVANQACIRALRQQAEQLLPQRLDTLARKYDFEYASVSVKKLKGRWGSCDHQKNIVLNLYLMQLPWELIDYVLMHELTHTKILQHGSPFWASMEEIAPGSKELRKRIKSYQPTL